MIKISQLYLKNDNTQSHQKIKLYGSLTTKDLKKTHSSRWVQGAEWNGKVAAAVAMEQMGQGYLGSQ